MLAWRLAFAFLALGLPFACSPAPQPESAGAAAATDAASAPDEAQDAGAADSSQAADAAVTDGAAEGGDAASPYVEPPPIRIYRFHVYATMRSRWKKRVQIVSLVKTSRTEELEVGTEAVLERKLEPAPADGQDWVPVADVRVTKLGKGGKITLEIVTEHPEAQAKRKRSPWRKRTKVRLQIDRQVEDKD